MSDESGLIPISPLREWFHVSKRDFPWRHDRSLYRVLVSEFMLQQTRASVVIPYYLKWMEQLPSPESLLDFPEENLLKIWEGLGYYRRARHLRLASLSLLSNQDWDRHSLSLLPGVGPYISSAVACFALREKGAIPIDGNVARVLVRFWGLFIQIRSSSVRQLLENALRQNWSQSDAQPEDFESLIELGALVCLPRSPRCEVCPLRKRCLAYRNNLVTKLPIPHVKSIIEISLRAVCVMLEADGSIWICPSEKVKGLWEFPSFLLDPNETIESFLKKKNIQDVLKVFSLITYQVTRFKIQIIGVLIEGGRFSELREGCHLFHWKDLLQKPFCSGHRKLLDQVRSFLGER